MKKTFLVHSHITKETADEAPQYKVVFKCEKDKLTLHSEDRTLFQQYPKGEEFQIDIKQEQQKLGDQ